MKRHWIVLITAAALIGCGKKDKAQSPEVSEGDASAAAASGQTTTAPAEAAPAPGKEVLPGANAIRAALQKKDYDAAVGSLLALRPTANTPEKTIEYSNVYGEVIDTLRAESATDRKAAEALVTLQGISRGR